MKENGLLLAVSDNGWADHIDLAVKEWAWATLMLGSWFRTLREVLTCVRFFVLCCVCVGFVTGRSAVQGATKCREGLEYLSE